MAQNATPLPSPATRDELEPLNPSSAKNVAKPAGSLSQQLMLSFIGLLLLLLVVAGVALWNLWLLRDTLDDMIRVNQTTRTFSELENAAYRGLEAGTDLIASRSMSARQEIQEAQLDWINALNDLGENSNRSEERLQYMDASGLLQQLGSHLTELEKLVDEGRMDVALNYQIANLEPLEEDLETLFSEEIGPQLMADVTASQQQVDRSIRASVSALAALTIVALILGIFMLYGIGRNISRPLKMLSLTVQDVAQGNLNRSVDIQARGEIGVLAESFNEMLERLRTMLVSEQEQRSYLERLMARERDQREALQELLGQVRGASEEIATVVSQITTAAVEQATSASEQSAALSEINTTVGEVKTIAQQASLRAQDVSVSAQRTVDVSRAGQQAVQQTLGSMEQIRQHVGNITANILALSEQTQQIREIIATVSNLAARSNMLALNASIEASRAGEQGKGFAVVAQEVRRLSEKSHQAVDQIEGLLAEIQKSTHSTVMVTEEGTKSVDLGLQTNLHARQAIEQLWMVIEESAQVALQMVSGGQQQVTGVDQIAQAMHNVHLSALQNLDSSRQVENAAQDLTALAQRLEILVSQYHPE